MGWRGGGVAVEMTWASPSAHEEGRHAGQLPEHRMRRNRRTHTQNGAYRHAWPAVRAEPVSVLVRSLCTLFLGSVLGAEPRRTGTKTPQRISLSGDDYGLKV